MGLWLWTMPTAKHHKNDALFIYLFFCFHLFNACTENCAHQSPKLWTSPRKPWRPTLLYYGSCLCPALLRRSLLVLGRSGSGKSTLLRALLKKQFPDYTGPLHFGSSEKKSAYRYSGPWKDLIHPQTRQTEWQSWHVEAGNVQMFGCFAPCWTIWKVSMWRVARRPCTYRELQQPRTRQVCSLKQNYETVMSHERLWIYCWFHSLSAWKLPEHFWNSWFAVKGRACLTAVGLSSVPSWCKPYEVLSAGERPRAGLVSPPFLHHCHAQ